MRRVLFLLVLLFASTFSFGQIIIQTTSSADSISYGEVVTVDYKISITDNSEVKSIDFTPIHNCLNFIYEMSPGELDSLMKIEVVDGGAFKITNEKLILTSENTKGKLPLEGSVQLRVTSIGGGMIPKPIVTTENNVSDFVFDAPMLFVNPKGNGEINPDHGIIEENWKWTDLLKYVYFLIAIALVLLFAYYTFKKMTKEQDKYIIEKEKIKPPADKVALEALTILKGKELWQNGEVKQYHTELTKIMRQYIEDRYSVQALEMTSSQLNRELNKQGIDKNIVLRFNDILQIADKVKFAKGSAGPEINTRFLKEAFEIVAETKEIINENEGEND